MCCVSFQVVSRTRGHRVGIKVERENLSVEVDLSSSDELLIKYQARQGGCQTEVIKVVERVTPELKEEWRTIITGGDELSQFSQQRAMALLDRLALGFGNYVSKDLNQLGDWLINSREITNFTWDISDLSLTYFAHAVSLSTNCTLEDAIRWVREPLEDPELQEHLRQKQLTSAHRVLADDSPRFGRRLVWYAMVRATKPGLVIETGIDKGLGSVLLCAAVKRNSSEGHTGRYLGTDIEPSAGYLLDGTYKEHGSIAYGDSIESLQKLDEPIDLFINDSDHSHEYEAREYETVEHLLHDESVILGDNAHTSMSLAQFAAKTKRLFTMVPEYPENHWYRGCGVGIAYRR